MNEEENLTPAEQEQEEEPSSPSASRGRSVFPYLAVLFATAFLLLLFAYLMQQRDSEEIMGNLSDLRESMGSIQSIDQLIEENHGLRAQKENLESRITELEKQISDLEAELTVSHSMEEQWQGRKDTAEGIANAFDTLNRMRALYDQGRIAECKKKLEDMEANRTEVMIEVGQDPLEYYLGIHVGKFVGLIDNSDFLDIYNPLEDWLALKEAILEAEIEEE